MARTNTYKKQVQNTAAYVNKKIREIENTFGIGSEQYDRYVNAITAALPVGSYKLNESGKIRIKGGKTAGETLTKGELKPVVNLPTAGASMKAAKASIAKNKLQREGNAKPSKKEIADEAVSISDQEALQELYAKAFIQNRENAKGKLKYSEESSAALKQKGAKSYQELREILEKGDELHEQKQAAKKERKAEYQRRYREEHREEVNRKQREYRARRKAAQNAQNV